MPLELFQPIFLVAEVVPPDTVPLAGAGALIWYLLRKNQEDVPKLLTMALEAIHASNEAARKNAEASAQLTAAVQDLVRNQAEIVRSLRAKGGADGLDSRSA